MITLLSNEQTDDLVNLAKSAICAAEMGVDYVVEVEGGHVALDAQTVVYSLQFTFNVMGFCWPTVDEDELRQFCNEQGLVYER